MDFFTAAPEEDEIGKRIDVYIAEYKEEFSRSRAFGN